MLGDLFWAAWISLVTWQWLAEWQTQRYLGTHDPTVPQPVVLSRKRIYDGPDGLHYYCTFKVPGALPMELEVSADTYACARRGDRGTVLLENDGGVAFQRAG
jgi:hypothetical protein